MNKRKKLIVMILLFAIVITGCDIDKNEENEPLVTKVEIDSIMYNEFNNLLEDEYGGEPYYTKEEWINEKGELLFPYENNKELMSGIENILASLYMPEEVLEKAYTKDLLKVICEGWFSTNVTMPSIYNNPSEYILYSSSTNQAVNELLQRGDMVEIVFDDYCKRNYVIETEVNEQNSSELKRLQFEEIVLGSNHAFSLMDDSMREKVLSEVLKKNENIKGEEYDTSGLESGFFSMIEE